MTSQQLPRSFAGYVMRGGPRDGEIRDGSCPGHIRFEHGDGTSDFYDPSSQPDHEHPEHQRYDWRENVPARPDCCWTCD